MASIMRSKYRTFPEYHTSLDDLGLISPAGLGGAYTLYVRCLSVLDGNRRFRALCPCEPQLGKRGLYPQRGTRSSAAEVRNILNVLAYSDGQHDLVDIANLLAIDVMALVPIARRLVDVGLLEELAA